MDSDEAMDGFTGQPEPMAGLRRSSTANSDMLHNLAATVQTPASSAAAWNTKKFREEYDMAKARLSDQSFHSCECSLLSLAPSHRQSGVHSQGLSKAPDQTAKSTMIRHV